MIVAIYQSSGIGFGVVVVVVVTHYISSLGFRGGWDGIGYPS